MSDNSLLIIAAIGAGAYFIINRRHTAPYSAQAVSTSQGSAIAPMGIPVASTSPITTPVMDSLSPSLIPFHITNPVPPPPPPPQVANPNAANYVAIAPEQSDVVVNSPYAGIIYVNPEFNVPGGPASGEDFAAYMTMLMQKYASGVSYSSLTGPPADYLYLQAHMKQTGGIHG